MTPDILIEDEPASPFPPHFWIYPDTGIRGKSFTLPMHLKPEGRLEVAINTRLTPNTVIGISTLRYEHRVNSYALMVHALQALNSAFARPRFLVCESGEPHFDPSQADTCAKRLQNAENNLLRFCEICNKVLPERVVFPQHPSSYMPGNFSVGYSNIPVVHHTNQPHSQGPDWSTSGLSYASYHERMDFEDDDPTTQSSRETIRHSSSQNSHLRRGRRGTQSLMRCERYKSGADRRYDDGGDNNDNSNSYDDDDDLYGDYPT
jgi:hypothetical protein